MAESEVVPIVEGRVCLSCGGELESGEIVGQQRFLNWEPAGVPSGRTMHGKEHLARGSLRAGPRLPAERCRTCGMGFFRTTLAS